MKSGKKKEKAVAFGFLYPLEGGGGGGQLRKEGAAIYKGPLSQTRGRRRRRRKAKK